MDQQYIDDLGKEKRVAWGLPIFIRLWLSGLCQSQAAQSWTIAQLAIVFEVTQAYLFREEPHTATSLARELKLPIQTVSRTVRDLRKMGLITQIEASDDARKKILQPAHESFERDAMVSLAHSFCSQWFHGWDELDKARGAEWYFPMSRCSNNVAKKGIDEFKLLAKNE